MRRRFGMNQEISESIVFQLLLSKKVLLVSDNERRSSIVEMVTGKMKERHSCDLNIEVVTNKVPANNRRLVFDEHGEVVDFEILPQKEVFVGWNISRKQQ